MPACLPLLAALLAALLGPPAGLALGLAAWCAGRGAAAAVGLALLGAAGGAGRAPGPAAPELTGGRLTGRWESGWPGLGRVHAPAGAVEVELAQDLRAPPAGTPVRVLLRGRGERAPLVVACERLGAPRGLWLARLRERAAARVHALLRPPERGLVLALLLGTRHDLHPASQADARRTGTAHLLALSGLHVVLLARLLRAGARGLLARAGAVEAAGLTGFACLAGGRPSLWRATLGRLLAQAGALRGSGPGALHRLGAVALLLALLRPDWFAQLGTQLSFLAVGGLLCVSRLLPGGAWQALAPAGAFLVTAPLAAATFGEVQPVGLLVTPLLVPLLALLLGAGVLALLAGCAGPALDDAFAALLGGTAELVLALLELLAARVPAPLAPRPLPVPPLLASVLALAALLVLAARRPERERFLARAS